jgi:hypothetical protein
MRFTPFTDEESRCTFVILTDAAGWPSRGFVLSTDHYRRVPALGRGDAQMLFFVNHGYRVIAHDRRGHGRSAQVSDGLDMDHYADDLAALTAHLDLKMRPPAFEPMPQKARMSRAGNIT